MAGPGVDVAQDAFGLSSAEAGQVLAERSADFATPVPTAEQVQDAHDARVRLAALVNNETWARNFMNGSIPERQEFEALTQAIASEGEAGGYNVEASSIEVTVGDQVRRQDVIAEIGHLSKVGIPAEGIERILTGDFPLGSVEEAQALLDKGMATKEWREALLAGDPETVHSWTVYCAIVSSGKAA
jgi:hypothetical protein